MFCVVLPLISMLTLQPSALRGIVRRAGVVPLAEMLPAHGIVAVAPEGFASTLITSFRPWVIVAHEERMQPINSNARERMSYLSFTGGRVPESECVHRIHVDRASMVTIANAFAPSQCSGWSVTL